MTTLLSWRRITVFAVGGVTVLLAGCAIEGDGYGYGGADYGVGYYEPGGVVYGGWGPDYRVAPYRGGDHREDRRGGETRAHAYRAAPGSHATPSLPSHSRGGGERGSSHH